MFVHLDRPVAGEVALQLRRKPMTSAMTQFAGGKDVDGGIRQQGIRSDVRAAPCGLPARAVVVGDGVVSLNWANPFHTNHFTKTCGSWPVRTTVVDALAYRLPDRPPMGRHWPIYGQPAAFARPNVIP